MTDWTEAARLRAEGWSLQRIADRLGVSRQHVYRQLKSVDQHVPKSRVCRTCGASLAGKSLRLRFCGRTCANRYTNRHRRSGVRTEVSIIAEVQRLLDTGVSMWEASIEAGVSHSAVADWRDRGLVRYRRPRKPRCGAEDRRRAIGLMAAGVPQREVALAFGVGRATVQRWWARGS